MKIKKFVAANMQQAMQQIRQELGDEAVIISSTKEPIRGLRQLFGQRKIEVTAAVDDIPDSVPESRKVLAGKQVALEEGTVRTQPGDGGRNRSGGAMPQRIIPGSLVPAKLPDPILRISGEKENSWFRIILQQEMNKGGACVQNGAAGKWKKIFSQIEVNQAITEIMLKDLPPTAEQDPATSNDIFKVHLKARIINLLKPAYNKDRQAKIHTFIGPTGVGKTLTLVKLAARMKVVEKKQIAMIAIFNHRFGAMEKLDYYGKIIGAPVEVVMTPAELCRAVQLHSDKDVIFIDTEGRPSRNQSQVLELQSFIGSVKEPQNIYLVLSTPTKNRDLLRIANDFRLTGYNGIIMTKMDETDTYGPMLNLTCNTGVPVAYVTNGQNVPDDIERVTPKRFAEILLGSVVLDEDSQA